MSRRVALITNATDYIGPALARALAPSCDLVLGDPAPGLLVELSGLGASCMVVEGAAPVDLEEALVDLAMSEFGRLDAAAIFSGRVVTGRLIDSSDEDLDKVLNGCVRPVHRFLRAVLKPMVEARQGQVLVVTSATAVRPSPGAGLYSAARAAATMLAKAAAAEHARHGIQVNALGTNFIDFPEFLRASGATDPEVRSFLESQVPLRRLGGLDEVAAMCLPFLDGTSRFTTGQMVAVDGGWS